MADNLANWKTFIGEAFNIKRPEQGEDDKTYFALKTLTKGTIINCTLWDNSHAHVELGQGDVVVVNGKLRKRAKDDGDGFWYNLSVSRIGIIAMDSGVDDRDEDAGDHEAPAKKTKKKPAADEGVADDDDVM